MYNMSGTPNDSVNNESHKRMSTEVNFNEYDI